jgi:hypothetical protein
MGRRLIAGLVVTGALAAGGVGLLASCTDLIENLPTPDAGAPLGALLTRTDPSCVAPPYGAHVVYQAQGNNHLFRIEAAPGAKPEDLSAKLDLIGTGSDEFINVAPDGDSLLIGTTRFGCDQACLAVVGRDACTAQVVVTGGLAVPSVGTAAIASGGAMIVYPSDVAPPRRDLYLVRRVDATTWTAPVNLTATSPGAYNQRPAFRTDSATIVFDCGPDPNAGSGASSLCEIALNGTGLKVLKAADFGVTVTPDAYVAHGDYASDGTLVFEASINQTAQIWERAGGLPHLANDEKTPTGEFKYGSDTGPCVLPDNRIVSTWALRDPVKNFHELKVMDLAGTSPQVLLTDVDVVDNGIGCGR